MFLMIFIVEAKSYMEVSSETCNNPFIFLHCRFLIIRAIMIAAHANLSVLTSMLLLTIYS